LSTPFSSSKRIYFFQFFFSGLCPGVHFLENSPVKRLLFLRRHFFLFRSLFIFFPPHPPFYRRILLVPRMEAFLPPPSGRAINFLGGGRSAAACFFFSSLDSWKSPFFFFFQGIFLFFPCGETSLPPPSLVPKRYPVPSPSEGSGWDVCPSFPPFFFSGPLFFYGVLPSSPPRDK